MIKKPKKRKTLKKAKKEAWVQFSLYIRTRDCLRTTGSPLYGECFTCNASLPISQLQAGHFISGRHNANLFSERGVHAQCKRCNCLEHGRQLEYRRQIIKLYGEGADLELEREAQEIRKYTVDELENLTNRYKEMLKEIR